MRITNTMITNNTKANINTNKLLVDKYNTQMTTQKKISKASENPVIAIRSLRLSTTLSQLNQYLDNNIKDAQAWMNVTETALTNMRDLLRDIRTHCVNGSTDSKNVEDRQTILQSLKALAEQVYAEGNADYAGKTVFTGYRSSSNLTFDKEELDTVYDINQSFTFSDLEEKRYYTGSVDVPEAITSTTPECDTNIEVNTYERIRLAYNGNTELKNLTIEGYGTIVSWDDATSSSVIDANWTGDGSAADQLKMSIYDSEQDWELQNGTKTVGDYEIVYIKETGEFIFGKEIANEISTNQKGIDVEYQKTGFDKGELRPEYYYDCTDTTDPTKPVTYTKQNQEIKYTIANNTTITINTQADEVFNCDILRDVEELVNVVQKALDAAEKVTEITNMMSEEQYQDAASQKMLQGYLDAAQKESDYADDNLQKTFKSYITRFNGYLTSVDTAITNVGSQMNSLTLTQTRVENQKTTIEELKSDNEDREISDVIIDYYAAYNAYQSSLTAAGKLGQSSLLDYI